MRYTVISTKAGKEYGFEPHTHRCNKKGSKMVLNEEELLLIAPTAEAAASIFGGKLMSEYECLKEIEK